MRKTMMVLASVAIAMVVLGGVAWAATIQCPAKTKCFGTNAADTLKGNKGKNLMYGKRGGDTLYGYKAPDYLSGGEGSDKLYSGPGGYRGSGSIHWDKALGGPGSDSLYGGEGFDDMSGGIGSDKVYGGAGRNVVIGGPAFCTAPLNYSKSCPTPPEFDSSDDYIHGGPGSDHLGPGWVSGGVDHLYGEDGNDTFDVNQRDHQWPTAVTKEIVDCGPGDDWVYYDEGVDVVNSNCEVLKDNYGNPGT
jgi:Ca2+-binding RTX toxin-like protein